MGNMTCKYIGRALIGITALSATRRLEIRYTLTGPGPTAMWFMRRSLFWQDDLEKGRMVGSHGYRFSIEENEACRGRQHPGSNIPSGLRILFRVCVSWY